MKIVCFVSRGEIRRGELVGAGTARVIDGDWMAYAAGGGRDIVEIDRLLAPIVPTDILCIGVNYRQHAAETGSAIPENPMLFIKSSNTLNDPGAAVVLPRNSGKVDFEAELAVVDREDRPARSRPRMPWITFTATRSPTTSRPRDWQREKSLGGGQFARGKSFDTFCPIGPHIVTKDEIADPNQLAIKLTLNGETMQDASTADMIYGVPQLIASLSSTMTLRPGAVLLTGTPHGVGMGRNPPVWLKAGDKLAVMIEKIGTLENVCAAE